MLGLVSMPSMASSQGRSELRGTVTDQTGAPISGALVTALSQTAGPYTTHTDLKGQYRLAGLRPGRHRVTINLTGFAPVERQVDITDAEAPPLDVTLQLLVSVEVDVVASLAASRTLSSIVLDGAAIAALPSDPRLFWQRLAEMAGFAGRTGDLTLNVDGFEGRFRLPPRETIQTIRIDTNPFGTEFQEPGRGRVEIVTKPGSERTSGEAALAFSDESLNAKNAFAADEPKTQYRSYIGYVSGPVIRGRLGLLLYGGRWEQSENAVVYATTIDPITYQPTPVNETVATPVQTTSVAARANFLAGRGRTGALFYEHRTQTADNRGVGGYNLAEHGFDTSSIDHLARFSLLSTSRNFVHDTRVEFTQEVRDTRAQLDAPAINVLDAFNGGGNPYSRFDHSFANRVDVVEVLTYALGRHTLKGGFGVDVREVNDTKRANFGGQFTFGSDFERDAAGRIITDDSGQTMSISPLETYRRTLRGDPGYGPSQFVISDGDPVAKLAYWTFAWFVQDEWQLSPRLTMSYGVRQHGQSDAAGGLNLAPRAGLSWGANGGGTLRAGGGLFYDHVRPDPLLQTIRLDGRHQRQQVVQYPDFFSDVPAVLSGERLVSTTSIPAPDLRPAQLLVTSLNYEHPLPWGAFASAGYSWQRGRYLLRSRHINAPLEDGTLLFPDRGPVIQLESSGSSDQHILDVRWRQNIGRAVMLYATYTLGSHLSDTDGFETLPSDSFALGVERGPAADDVRHQIAASGTISLPGGVSLSPYLSISSAPPFNITTGLDNNADTSFTDRPSLVEDGNPNGISTPYGLLAPNPGPGGSVISRNLGRQARRVDVSLTASLRLPYGFALKADASNLLNRVTPTAFNGVLTNLEFGQPTQALPARRIELGLTKNF
jgi:hypothetical protein